MKTSKLTIMVMGAASLGCSVVQRLKDNGVELKERVSIADILATPSIASEPQHHTYLEQQHKHDRDIRKLQNMVGKNKFKNNLRK